MRSAIAGALASEAQVKSGTQAFLAAIHGRRFWPVIGAHLRFALIFQAPLVSWYYLWLLGRFLFGHVAGAQRWFDEEAAGHVTRLRRLLGYGLLAALPGAGLSIDRLLGGRLLGALKGVKGAGVAAQIGLGVVDQVGLLGLAAAYLGLVALLMRRQGWRRFLGVFAPPGRMPLTTYVLQSVICTALFYGWGLGWAGRVRAAGCVAIAVAVYAVEVLACHLWLRRFRFGPLEWIWRTLVYLRPPPMRAAAQSERSSP